jgi:bacterioferritin
LPQNFVDIGNILTDNLDLENTQRILDLILQAELAGVVRYTHSSLMITGPNRIPLVAFMKAQATESLLHAQQVGEILTGLDGHPTQLVGAIEETNRHGIHDILEEAWNHERHALSLYRELLHCVDGASVYLEEFARTMIGQEELHGLELRKMLRDFAPETVG